MQKSDKVYNIMAIYTGMKKSPFYNYSNICIYIQTFSAASDQASSKKSEPISSCSKKAGRAKSPTQVAS
jgi:hypothetical protein